MWLLVIVVFVTSDNQYSVYFQRLLIQTPTSPQYGILRAMYQLLPEPELPWSYSVPLHLLVILGKKRPKERPLELAGGKILVRACGGLRR